MKRKSKVIVALAAVAGIAAGYITIIRPRLNRWGATRREVDLWLPGDELVPAGSERITHVLDIDADVEEVWPWLMQIGQGRGGFYSYAWLENLLGSDIRNVGRINGKLQMLREGDTLALHPKTPPLQVVNLDPPYNMVLSAIGPVRIKLDGTLDQFVWSFHLRPHGRGSSRLLSRLRASAKPSVRHFLSALVLEPGHFLLERKMMLTIKALAERGRIAREMLPSDSKNPTVR